MNSIATTSPSQTPAIRDFYPLGQQHIQGFETTLTGYVTPDWQSTLGYAYTDARAISATSATIVAGNRIQLVPLNQFSWWNKYQFTPVWSGALGVVDFSEFSPHRTTA